MSEFVDYLRFSWCFREKNVFLLQKKIMYYIWFDESDKEGAYYSNFYGGILVDSKNYVTIQRYVYDELSNLK